MYNNYFYPPNLYQFPYADSMTIRNDSFQLTRISGDIEFEFQTDADGNFIYQTSVYGGGFTAYTDGYIMYPDALYNIDVTSSDGGHCYFENVRANQHVRCTLETSIRHKTTITVKLHSSIPLSRGKAHIHYNT